MLHNWIKPIIPGDFLEGIQPEAPVWGNAVIQFSEASPSLQDVQIAIVGIGDQEADAVRRVLYAMSFPFEGLRVADLGNMRRQDNSFLIAPIRELTAGKILPILIGRDPANMPAQYKAFLSLQNWISFAVVDETLRVSGHTTAGNGSILDDVLLRRESRLFHFGLIGHQSHLMLPAAYGLLEERHFDSMRLGATRDDFESVEPVIRDADVFAFHLAAIRQSDAPAQETPSPSGFTVEEACRICRYAGMSDKLKSLGIYGFRADMDAMKQTAQVVAQMVWYSVEGFYQRKGDFPASTEGMVEYVVDIKDYEYPLVFWKSGRSGRWWLQLAEKAGRKPQRHRLIPCTYNDYRMACRNELPDRLIHALRRFG